MRNLKLVMLLIMTMSLFTLSSCSSDDDGGGGGGNAPSGVLTAKVDGANFQSMEISSSATIANAGSSQNLVIIASNSDGNAVQMLIIGYTGAGTYPIGGGANILNSGSYSEIDINNPTAPETWQAPYDDTQVGTITITSETDTKVIGTFEFMCKNVNGDQSIKNLTEGAFDLNKQTTG